MANISDHVSLYNISPFGKCHTTRYPSTGAATAANKGKLTPMPCVPGTVSDWLNGKDDYIIKGKPALLKSSYCRCQWGGVITITDDGQEDTGSADLSREQVKTEEEMKAESEKNNQEDSEKQEQKENKFAVDNTEKYNSSHAEYLKRETRDTITEKELLFTKKLQTTSLTLEPFDKNNIDKDKQSEAEIKHIENLSKYKNVTKNAQNWLTRLLPVESKPPPETDADNPPETDIDSDGNNTKLFKLGVSKGDPFCDFYVDTKREASQIAETGNLDLKLLDFNPYIKNTRTTLRITFDLMFASLSIGLSLGVDSAFRKYFQLNLKSHLGGDYNDIIKLPYSMQKKKFKVLAKRIIKNKAFVKIEPKYETNVDDPLCDWWDGGYYVDVDLKLDKLLQVKLYNDDLESNFIEAWKNKNISITGQCSITDYLTLEYGWDSGKLEENAGFSLSLKVNEDKLLDDSKTSETNGNKSGAFSNYKMKKFDVEAVAKIGADWTYTWELKQPN